MGNAKSLIQMFIEKLPTDFIKAQPTIRQEIAPLLLDMEEGIQHYYLNLIIKKTKATAKAIHAELEAARKEKRERETKEKQTPSRPRNRESSSQHCERPPPLQEKNRRNQQNGSGRGEKEYRYDLLCHGQPFTFQ